MQVLRGTITSLEDIRKDDASIASQIQASIEMLSAKGVDAHGEFWRLHPPRRRPHRLDENSATTADISMVAFYEKEFKAVLDTLIQQYKENMKACLKKVKALSIVLQPPLSSNHNDADLKELLALFPKQAPDQAAFAAEFEVFVNVVNMAEGNTETGATIVSMADAAAEAEKRKHLFPLTNRIYRLALETLRSTTRPVRQRASNLSLKMSPTLFDAVKA